MSKEYLEALNIIKFNPDDVDGLQYLEAFKVVEKALQRLEAIDNAKPSEALKELEQDIKDRVILAEDKQLKLCAVIKQDLLKSQENKKALKIIFEKDVNIKALKHYLATYDSSLALKLYNSNVNKDEKLTEEEFELLKRYFDRKENE